jgi:hypothetical protein
MREQPHYTDLLTEEFFVKHYIQARMSFLKISTMLKEQGKNISVGCLYKYAQKFKIGRDASESKRNVDPNPLDYSKSFLCEPVFEHLDGFLLGDGHISIDERSPIESGRATCGLQYEEFTKFMMTGFDIYHPVVKPYSSANMKSGIVFDGKTKFHPDLYKQWQRWYRIEADGKPLKRIPYDVRLTPRSVMLWYLGDGSLTQSDSTCVVRLSTDGFLKEDVEFLAQKLCDLGISCHRNGDNRIYIESRGIPKFFDFIGRESPVACYSYKFDLPEWRFEAKTMREVADELKIDYNKLSYWVKIGRVPCLREHSKAKPRFLQSHIEAIHEASKLQSQ